LRESAYAVDSLAMMETATGKICDFANPVIVATATSSSPISVLMPIAAPLVNLVLPLCGALPIDCQAHAEQRPTYELFLALVSGRSNNNELAVMSTAKPLSWLQIMVDNLRSWNEGSAEWHGLLTIAQLAKAVTLEDGERTALDQMFAHTGNAAMSLPWVTQLTHDSTTTSGPAQRNS
jgi:hypothetical protein